jgi:phospholipase C
MPSFLKTVSVQFDSHDDGKDPNTHVHIFVKNRLNNSLSPEQHSDFISNSLALRRYQVLGDINDGDRNPYLAYKSFQGHGEPYDDPSSKTITLDPVSDHIDVNDVVMPEIDIHMLADGDDRWIFDYTVTLTFDNGEFSFTSSADGVSGIVLDQDNRNHSGIGVENPLRDLPLPVKTTAVTGAILKTVMLEFSTHNDDKDADTALKVHIANRLSATSAQDIAIGLDLFPREVFPDSGTPAERYRKYTWSSDPGADGPLVSNTIRLADMILPVVYIVVAPKSDARWIFDYRVTFVFEDPSDFGHKPQFYSSQTNGVILGEHNNKHSGAYQGRPFPTVAPPTAPTLTPRPVDHTGDHRKRISLPFLQRKFDEFINNRNGPDTSHNPPLQKVHLGSSQDISAGGPPDWPLPESYADLRAIAAAKADDTLEVRYVSNPTSLGQLTAFWGLADSFLGDIDSETMSLSTDAQSATPITLQVDFKPGGTLWNHALDTVTVDHLSIAIGLTLDKTPVGNGAGLDHSLVDVMSWVAELDQMRADIITEAPRLVHYVGTFLHQHVDVFSPQTKSDLFVSQVINVSLHTDAGPFPGTLDANGTLTSKIRDSVYGMLTTPDAFTMLTGRDGINARVTSWLCGGVGDDELNTDGNNTRVAGIGIENANPELGIAEDSIVIDYTGPRNIFVPESPVDWPAGHDFSSGALASIDHIVVLIMENRSFDHMLGYLSLPVAQNGMDRSDVDGLRGGESNTYNGETFASVELTETIFSPDPPHGYEPVHHAINGGQMDGFVQSYGEAHGDQVAGSIMGFHTAANVPVYDSLARDFAIGHRWFASHPGPTFCNRFYALTGRLNLDARGFWEFDNSSPVRPVFTPTIFDHLSDAVDPQTQQPVTWRYFEHGYCSLRFYEGHTFDHTNIVAADDPHIGFFASARAGALPNVTFIDPHFIELPPDANCDGPPSDVKDGQAFVQRVVEAVVASPAWEKTLLLIVYDEHGGFFDHVPPPAAVPVSPDLPITTTGVRVPAVVVSPWVAPGTVFGHDGTSPPEGGTPPLHFDHTSILKTIAKRFLSTDPPYMGARFAAAEDLSSVMLPELPQRQFRPFIPYQFKFSGSGMMLDVQFASRAPGTILWQFAANGTVAQDYSIEATGDGFVYIRSHVSNLYVTVQVPDPVAIGDPEPAPVLIQEPRHPPRDVTPPNQRPALQRWTLSPASINALLDRDLYVISNEAFPGLVLQPADPTQAGAPIVLAAPGPSKGKGIHQAPKVWSVTSPLLSDQIVNKE